MVDQRAEKGVAVVPDQYAKECSLAVKEDPSVGGIRWTAAWRNIAMLSVLANDPAVQQQIDHIQRTVQRAGVPFCQFPNGNKPVAAETEFAGENLRFDLPEQNFGPFHFPAPAFPLSVAYT